MMTVKLIMGMCKTYPKSFNEFDSVIFFLQCKSLQDTKMKQGKRQTGPPAGESAADAARASLLLCGGVSACTEIILSCWVCWGFSHLVVLNVTYIPSQGSDQHPALSRLVPRWVAGLGGVFLTSSCFHIQQSDGAAGDSEDWGSAGVACGSRRRKASPVTNGEGPAGKLVG